MTNYFLENLNLTIWFSIGFFFVGIISYFSIKESKHNFDLFTKSTIVFVLLFLRAWLVWGLNEAVVRLVTYLFFYLGILIVIIAKKYLWKQRLA